jgi:prepilin-type N-terminal cleavage/methylation domain-containing protein
MSGEGVTRLVKLARCGVAAVYIEGMASSQAERERRVRRRGFTLVELMAVVAITGILAVVGVVLVRGHLRAAKVNDALAGIQAIRSAQEAYRAQNGQYLNCSSPTEPRWYPMDEPGETAYEWRQESHPDWPRWRELGVTRTRPTQFGFAVNAGNPGTGYPVFQTATDPVLSASPDPWYVIQVKGNLDGDSVPMIGIAASFNPEVYIENSGE